MAGFDAKDSTSVNHEVPDYEASLNKPIGSLRIGLPRCFLNESVDAGVQRTIQEALAIFVKEGAKIIEVDFAYQPYWVPCYYVIACAEASSNLSRYDGVRYGYRSKKQSSLRELITASRTEAFGEEVKRRILTGTYVLSAGYFDEYYLQALKIRQLIKEEFKTIFNQVDVILGPTTPTSTFKLGEKIINPVQSYLADVFTVPANLAGLPALSIPAGFDQGLPVGMQLIGNYFSESALLNYAHIFQIITDWHQHAPKMETQ